jgi:hypothetical protein
MKTNSKQPQSSGYQVNTNIYFGLAPSSYHLSSVFFVILPSARNRKYLVSLFSFVGCCTCPFLLSSQSSTPQRCALCININSSHRGAVNIYTFLSAPNYCFQFVLCCSPIFLLHRDLWSICSSCSSAYRFRFIPVYCWFWVLVSL